jgi:hypothetical protein
MGCGTALEPPSSASFAVAFAEPADSPADKWPATSTAEEEAMNFRREKPGFGNIMQQLCAAPPDCQSPKLQRVAAKTLGSQKNLDF